MSRTTELLGSLALLLILAGCGRPGAPGTATATPVPTAPGTAASAPTTAAPVPDNESATTTTPETAAAGAAPSPADEPEPTPAVGTSYPADPEAYAEQLVQAWAAQDGERIAALAVAEVELAAGTWTTPAAWGEPRSHDLALLAPQFAGLWLVDYEQEGLGTLSVTVDTAALGAEDAVVGVDLVVWAQKDDALRPVAHDPFTTYAAAFHAAVVAGDAAELERLGSEEVAATLMAQEPGSAGGVVVERGFLSYLGEPLGMLVHYPEADTATDPMLGLIQVVELDQDAVLQGADHAATRLNVFTDARWT